MSITLTKLRSQLQLPYRYEEEPDISFWDTVKAQMGYTYDPIIETISNQRNFPNVDLEYFPVQDLEGYEEFSSILLYARNAQHMASMKRGIDENIARREILAQSSLGAQLGAGFLDPFNFIALPMGAPALMGKQALRSAKILGGYQAGLETIRAPFDALSTADEVALNVAFSAVLGGLIGGATAVPRSLKNRALNNAIKDSDEKLQDIVALKYYSSMTDEEIKWASRPKTREEYNNKTNEDLKLEVEANNEQIFGLQEILNSKQWPDGRNATEIQLKNIERKKENIKFTNTKILQESAVRRVTETNLKRTDKYDIAAGGWITKFLSTPTKRTLSAAIPDKAKESFLKMSYDAGLKLNLHEQQEVLGLSVQQLKLLHRARWIKLQQDSIQYYGDFINTKIKTYGGLQFNDIGKRINNKFKNTNETTHDSFVIEATRKKIFNEESSPAEIKFQNHLFGEFKKYGEEAVEQGLIGRKTSYKTILDKERIKLEKRMQNFAKYKNPSLDWVDHHNMMVGKMKQKIASLEEELAYFQYLDNEGKGITPAGETLYFPHIINKTYAKKYPEGLKQIIKDHYTDNPFLLKFKNNKIEKIDLDDSIEEIEKRVERTYQKLIGVELGEEVPITSGGTSRHFKHRELNIPTEKLWPYLVQDPLAVFKGYSEKASGHIEFAKVFNRKSINEVLDEEIDDMYAAGISTENINLYRRDFKHMYQRIVTSPRETDPSRLDNASAYFLKEAATVSYLGSAGIAALPDFGSIIMQHEMPHIIKGIQALINDSSVTLNAREGKLAGEVAEMFQNNSHLRIVEDTTGDIRSATRWDKIKNAFFIANGLAPITQLAKAIDATIRSHSLIDMSVRFKKLNDWEKTYLAAYNIDEQKAMEIANAPWQKSENGLYKANTEDWEDNYQLLKTDSIIKFGDTNKYIKKIYKPIVSNKKTNTLKIDIDFIKGNFSGEPWKTSRMKDVNPLPEKDAKGNLNFPSPQMWANFVLQKEMLRLKFAPKKFTSSEIRQFVKNISSKDAPKNAPSDFKKLIEEKYPLVNFDEDDLIDGGFYSMIDDKTISPEATFENILNDVTLILHQQQPKITEETLTTFRSALQTGILNTVIQGGPADKPIIIDGVAYINMRIAKQFGMKEHPEMKGYARIESGLLGFPFQFYSYALGAVNRISAGITQNRLKQRMLGIAVSLGLGMMVIKLKTPNWAFDEMTWRDWFVRGFDQSGIAAIYTDIMYQSMQTSLSMGGPNISGGLIKPKFVDDNGVAAAVGLAGAGPSVVYDYADALKELLYDGDFGEGAKKLWRALPFTGLWFWKDEMNQLSNGFRRWL